MILENVPIKRKIVTAVMLTTVTVLVLTVAAFVVYELITKRQDMVRGANTVAGVISDGSTAALAFGNEKDANDTLASLRNEPQVVQAALYDSKGQLFVVYPRGAPTNSVPATPGKIGVPHFGTEGLTLFTAVKQDGAQVGTLYLREDMGMVYRKFRMYAALTAAILTASIALALALSNRLQLRISGPILALADTARIVSEKQDYSVRAPRVGGDELGLLTDGFNHMLTRIEEQTVELRESEERLRLALGASRTGTWDWNLATGQLTWDDYNAALFGLKPGEFDGSYKHFLELIHPDDREAIAQRVASALDEKTEFAAEFRSVWTDGSVRYLASRGKALYDAAGKPVRMTGVTQDITERKQATEARSFLAAIVESSEDAIIGKDFTREIISWNRGAERMFGYTAEEIVGRPIDLIISPDRPNEEQEILSRARLGETRQYETVRIRKDGTRINIALTVSPIRSPDGAIVGVSSISRDITEQKRAEAELQESRARLSAIIGSAMDAIVSISEDWTIRLFNAAAEELFHCAAADAIGKPLGTFFPERLRESQQSQLAEREAAVRAKPLIGLRPNGEEFPIEASVSHIELAGQKISTVILRDVTERKRTEEALERQAAILREQAQMLDLANVMVRDLEDRIILWNTGMERMYGWMRSETLGRRSDEILQTHSPRPLAEIKTTLMRDGQWEGELVHTRRDGTAITVSSQWVLHRDPHGQPRAILEVDTDISERKAAAEQVLKMNAELEQRVRERTAELTGANHELEAFTYSVAHDLRAPLRHIDAFAKILFDDYATAIPSDAQRLLENIRRSSQNMSQLVDDLLNLARIGRQELKRELTPLKPVVEEVVSDLERETEGRRVEWHIGELPVMQSDPGLMKQVFANLLSNAVKYTRPREKAVIEIGERQLNGETVIYVHDNGVGFNMKYVGKLFGVFQRLHRSDEFEGTGVGLATVDRIVRKHGGRIWAEAEVDKGATFYFTFNGSGQHPEKTDVEHHEQKA